MRPSGLLIGLIVSVAINLFLLGVGAGVFALGARLAKDTSTPRPGAMFWATEALPQPERHDFRSAMTSARNSVAADAQRSLSLRADAWGQIAGPKPDVPAIEAQLAQSRQVDIAVRKVVEDAAVARAAGLSPADRALFAAGMRRALAPANH